MHANHPPQTHSSSPSGSARPHARGAPPPPYVLYVARQRGEASGREDADDAFTRGDQMCMRVVEARGLHAAVAVQDSDALREQGVDFPEWLTGTPTLVHRASMTKFTGTEAVMQLSSLRASAAEGAARRARPPSRPLSVADAPGVRGEDHEGRPPMAPMPASARRASPPSLAAEPDEAPMGDDGTPLRLHVDDEPDLDEDDHGDALEFGNLMAHPPVEDDPSASTKRVTEEDVKRFSELRRLADEARKAQ